MKAFLSHNSAEKPAVETLARMLETEGISCWLDKWNLIPGDPWDEAITNALNTCEVCVVFFGPNDVGPWHNEEMRLAIRRRVSDRECRLRVLPVILPNGRRAAESQLPPFLQGTTWVEFQQSLDEQDAFHRLKCGILGIAPGDDLNKSLFTGRCPYVGLKTFGQPDARLFFGRDALMQQILARQRENFGTSREHRFLALIGASGSGKSSLAAAGLLPAILERGELPDSSRWLCVRCRPSSNPWESLQIALASHVILSSHFPVLDTLVKSPDQEAHRLHLLARLALHGQPETHRLIVFVDQFEEFFTLYRTEQDLEGKLTITRRRFLDNLLYPATTADSRVLIMITMRADFYGQCASFDGLRAAVSENQVLIGPLTPGELRDVIEHPAQLCGCEVEPALVDRLVDDMERQPSALPFLQHALFKLWEVREGRRLTADAYRKMGSLEGALDAHSEAFYATLPEEQQELLRAILLDLIQLGEGAADTKRRKRLDQLPDGYAARLHPFIAELASAHLVVTDQSAGQVQVEISHEALITGWKRFHSWIDESRDEKRQNDRIELAAKEWMLADESKRNDFLWRGAQLESAEFSLRASTLSLNEEATRFLKTCREGRERENAENELAQKRERDRQQRLEEAETGRLRAEAQAEIERAQEIERRRQESITHAKSNKDRADELLNDFRNLGNSQTFDWRLANLAEVESLLVNAIALDGNLVGAPQMLAGVRRLLVETGIKTQDLNLASIYLQKLKASGDVDGADTGQLGKDVEVSWAEADPGRNFYVLRMRKWALIGCWLPLIWMGILLVVLHTNFEEDHFYFYLVGGVGALATVMHFLTALLAIMTASGDRRRISWTSAAAIALTLISLAALNLVSFAIGIILVQAVGKIGMQKLLWPNSKT